MAAAALTALEASEQTQTRIALAFVRAVMAVSAVLRMVPGTDASALIAFAVEVAAATAP